MRELSRPPMIPGGQFRIKLRFLLDPVRENPAGKFPVITVFIENGKPLISSLFLVVGINKCTP
jgi:hypothetical protein